jgi:hypothetical protein
MLHLISNHCNTLMYNLYMHCWYEEMQICVKRNLCDQDKEVYIVVTFKLLYTIIQYLQCNFKMHRGEIWMKDSQNTRSRG